jgi:hypothetical protein
MLLLGSVWRGLAVLPREQLKPPVFERPVAQKVMKLKKF